MSVENHRHCQATVLSANGTGNQNGASWDHINGLNLSNISPTNWKNKFLNNKQNITQDLKSILEIVDSTASKLNTNIDKKADASSVTAQINTITNNITTLNNKVSSLENQVGKQSTNVITVYIAPNNAYFQGNTDYEQKYDSELNTNYYVPRYDNKYSYRYLYKYSDGTEERRIYPGNDDNINLQFENYGADSGKAKMYPLLSLNAAMVFFRKFNITTNTTFRILCQWGDYNYSSSQTVQLESAIGENAIEITGNTMGTRIEDRDSEPSIDRRDFNSLVQTLQCYRDGKEAENNIYQNADPSRLFYMVPVRFCLNAGDTAINFSYSNIYIKNCGFVYQNGGATLPVYVKKNSTLYIWSCLFVNTRISTEDTSQIYFQNQGKWKSIDAGKPAIDYLWRYTIPTVFMHDSNIDTTNYNMLYSQGAESIYFQYAYVLFYPKLTTSIIALRYLGTIQFASKNTTQPIVIHVFYKDAESKKYAPIDADWRSAIWLPAGGGDTSYTAAFRMAFYFADEEWIYDSWLCKKNTNATTYKWDIRNLVAQHARTDSTGNNAIYSPNDGVINQFNVYFTSPYGHIHGSGSSYGHFPIRFNDNFLNNKKYKEDATSSPEEDLWKIDNTWVHSQ